MPPSGRTPGSTAILLCILPKGQPDFNTLSPMAHMHVTLEVHATALWHICMQHWPIETIIIHTSFGYAARSVQSVWY